MVRLALGRMEMGTKPGHVCNAWRGGGTHCSVMYSPTGQSILLPPRFEKSGYGRVTAVKIAPAGPECPLSPVRPLGYDTPWLVWWRPITPP